MSNSDTVKQLKNTLLDFCPTAIEELKALITSKKTTDKLKFDAILSVLNRVGLPELRASISQTLVGSPMDLTGLLEKQERFTLAEAKIDGDILEIEAKLGQADPVANPGMRGGAGEGR